MNSVHLITITIFSAWNRHFKSTNCNICSILTTNSSYCSHCYGLDDRRKSSFLSIFSSLVLTSLFILSYYVFLCFPFPILRLRTKRGHIINPMLTGSLATNVIVTSHLHLISPLLIDLRLVSNRGHFSKRGISNKKLSISAAKKSFFPAFFLKEIFAPSIICRSMLHELLWYWRVFRKTPILEVALAISSSGDVAKWKALKLHGRVRGSL